MDTYNAHSPFTIRLELLKLAQSIENDRIWVERNRLEQDWHVNKESSERRGTTIVSFPELPIVTYEDVIRVATELNKFVSSKG